MLVEFFDENDVLICTERIEGEGYDDVCQKAWDLIQGGRIEAEDFQVLDD